MHPSASSSVSLPKNNRPNLKLPSRTVCTRQERRENGCSGSARALTQCAEQFHTTTTVSRHNCERVCSRWYREYTNRKPQSGKINACPWCSTGWDWGKKLLINVQLNTKSCFNGSAFVTQDFSFLGQTDVLWVKLDHVEYTRTWQMN